MSHHSIWTKIFTYVSPFSPLGKIQPNHIVVIYVLMIFCFKLFEIRAPTLFVKNTVLLKNKEIDYIA